MSSINRVSQLYEQLEKELYSSLLSTLLSNDIVINDGKIVFNTKNSKYFDQEIRSLVSDIKPSVAKIRAELENAIKEALEKEALEFTRLDIRATEISKPIINRILKHSNLSVSQGIVLDPLFTKIKGRIVALVSRQGGISLQELRDSLQKLIVNKHLVNGYFERWTYDIYNQYRRAAANEIRKKLGFRFAVYEGGEIETTRDHCDKFAGLVLSEKEIEAWNDLPMWNGRPAEGYDPFIDCGGYNCRHRWRWITDGLATILLKEQGAAPITIKNIDPNPSKLIEPKEAVKAPEPTQSKRSNPDINIKIEKLEVIQKGDNAESVDTDLIKYVQVGSSYISENVNLFKMIHYTSSKGIVDLIKKEGFKIGNNSVYGEGVYFTSNKINDKAYPASLEVSLQPHKQLYVHNDYDTYKIVSEATGRKIASGFDINKAAKDAGFGSIRIKQDDGSFWTLVIDPKLINIK